jgi:hypothetical protein
MPVGILGPICLAFALSALAVAQTKSNPSPEVANVRLWIDKAIQTGDPVEWAIDLMQADAAAEKLEQDEAAGCCGVRCIRVGPFELHYRFNELAGKESYQHDLLQMIATVDSGSKDGADALVRLLSTSCETISNQWIPLFRTVLGILEERRWRDPADVRLTEIRGEAYETWWSLSKLSNNDALVTDVGMSPEDFADGAALARERAIQDYEILVKAHRASTDVMHRLADLKAGHDTQMRKWICYSD